MEKIFCECRRPINCYNDRTRYRTMIILYIFDLIFFIVRLSVVSHDISKNLSDRMRLLVPILIFDLIASLPIIIANLFYIVMRYCTNNLDRDSRSMTRLWRFATLTCFRFHCHKDRPQGILVMRILIIVCSFLLKFMCFVIAAACSARYQSECTAYTVIAAFALVVSILIIIVECINYFRLWKYNPTDSRNGKSNQTYTAPLDEFIKKTHRNHLGFIHHSLLNDQNARKFRQSRCKQGSACQPKTIHHYLFYHSLDADHHIDFTKVTEDEKRSFIAFYQTTKADALKIAEYGFPYGDKNSSGFKENLRLHPSIRFKCSFKENPSLDAIICARLNLERVISVNTEGDLNIRENFALNDGLYDTIYVKDTCQLHLRMPAQIEKWIITLNKSATVTDVLDGTSYQPCI